MFNNLTLRNKLTMVACAAQKKIAERVSVGNLILPVPDTGFRDFLDGIDELARFAPEIVAAVEADLSPESFKEKFTRKILVPLAHDQMRQETVLYITWYNRHRPSETLADRTPQEVYCRLKSANSMPRFDPRTNWLKKNSCAAPQTLVKDIPGATFKLDVFFLGGRPHLPIVKLKKSA